MRKSMMVAMSAVCAAVLQASPALSATHSEPSLEPFECQSSSSMNVAKFVTDGIYEPLLLETNFLGDTCGYEGGTVSGIQGVKFEHLNLQIAGTCNVSGFGPYIQVYYNGGSSVAQLPVKAGSGGGVFGIYQERKFVPADFGLPNGTVLDHVIIEANPTTGESGECFIRQLTINEVLGSKKRTVINACP